MDLELRLVRAFLAVADELHVGRAAERLNVTQPALSRQVQQLERRVGTELLVRSSHGVSLTEAGRVLRAEGERLLAQSDRAVDRIYRAGRGDLGHLSVGFIASALDPLVAALGTMRARHREVGFTLIERAFRQQTAGLASGEDDVAFVRDMSTGGAFDLIMLRSETLCLVVHHSHPFARRSQITRQDLLAELDERPVVTTRRWMTMLGLDPPVLDEVASTIATLRLVHVQAGVSVMPSGYASQAPRGVRFIPVNGAHSVLQLAHPRQELSPPAARFVELVTERATPREDEAELRTQPRP